MSVIKYPNGKTGGVKKSEITSTSLDSSVKDNSHYAHRGMKLEERINLSCEYYLAHDIAVVYKKPTPVQVVKFSNREGKYTISEAYFRQPSTTDYNGVYKGKYIDFEAKETAQHSTFILKNLPEHQMKHMINVQRHGAISFLIVCFWKFDKIYLIDSSIIAKHYFELKSYSIPIKTFESEGILIEGSYTCPIDFIQAIEKYYFKKN